MPVISAFYGITISMFFDDHAPPHVHAEYGEFEVLFRLEPISVYKGRAPQRVVALVREWVQLHQAELQANWERCRRHEQPAAVAPLD